MEALQFDLVLHLAGEQVLPNYMGVKLCVAPKHVMVVTAETAGLAGRIETELGRQNDKSKFFPVTVLAYDYPSIRKNFAAAAGKTGGARIGFNVTGGTKPMFAAALDFCRDTGAVPFYLDTALRKVHFLVEPYTVLTMPPVFTSVAEFAHLAGQQVQEEGVTPQHQDIRERTELTRLFWQYRNLVRRWIHDFADCTKPAFMSMKAPVSQYTQTVGKMRSVVDGKAPQVMQAWDAAFPPAADWRKAAVFAAGGWFEEFAILRLAPLLADGTLRDLRLGFTPTWEGTPKGKSPFTASQEFDVCFTDGYGLTILECKAGQIKQEHLQKLENLRLAFGGSFGRAAIVSANLPDLQTRRRLQNQRKIAIFAAQAVDQLPFHATDFKPGEIIGA